MNPQAIRDYSPLLADAVTAVLDQGEFPVVLGGDCSIVLGTMLALRRRGRYGLLYVDGDADADFYQPEVNPLSGAASASDLAFATGRGPGAVQRCVCHQLVPRPAVVLQVARRRNDVYRRTWHAAASQEGCQFPADDKGKGKEISLLATFNV